MENHEIASPGQGVRPGATAKPFSVRLTDSERQVLARRAGRTPLATFVRRLILSGEPQVASRQRAIRATIDHEALARVLASLGRSGIAANLERLALAAKAGALNVTPTIEAEIRDACKKIIAMRGELVHALGLNESDPS